MIQADSNSLCICQKTFPTLSLIWVDITMRHLNLQEKQSKLINFGKKMQ